MQITNLHGLPKPIVDAVSAFIRKPPAGDISATELIGPPLIRQLKKKHWHEMSEDAADRIWVLLGSAVHAILEKADTTNHLAEERIFADVLGWKISGQADLLSSDGVLSDYKVTSAYSFLFEKVEWDYQLNIYKWLYEQIGFSVNKLQIVAILRDWSLSRAKEDDEYPQVPVIVKPVLGLPIEGYIRNRVKLHQEADNGVFEPCTNAERWHRPDSWAVFKKGRKKAVRVLDDFDKVAEFVADKPCHDIQFRPGRDIRCESYCPVRNFCDYKRPTTDGRRH